MPAPRFFEVSFVKKAFNVTKNMVRIYTRQRVPRSAAAMAYYFTISIFPVLIVVYTILQSLHISQENLYKIWVEIIPPDAVDVISDYLNYVGGNRSTFMVIVGVLVTLTSSSAAFRSLLKIMADIQGESRYKGLRAGLYSLVISLGLLGAIYVSGFVILTGEWILSFLEGVFGSAMFDIWQWVRFAVLFLILLVVIYLVYKITAPKEVARVKRVPGAAIASVLLVAVSIIFSRLISMSANYPLVYGSLASFIILMFWVYICSIILIMGNVFNFVVYHKLDAEEGDPKTQAGDLTAVPADEKKTIIRRRRKRTVIFRFNTSTGRSAKCCRFGHMRPAAADDGFLLDGWTVLHSGVCYK